LKEIYHCTSADGIVILGAPSIRRRLLDIDFSNFLNIINVGVAEHQKARLIK